MSECLVCDEGLDLTVDADLRNGYTQLQTAERHGITRYAVQKHAQNCLHLEISPGRYLREKPVSKSKRDAVMRRVQAELAEFRKCKGVTK